MAKKVRRKSSAQKKKTKVSKARKTRAVARKAKATAKKAKRKTPRARKAKPKTFGQRIVSAFEIVTDTVKETDKLRNKMEPPATSETE